MVHGVSGHVAFLHGRHIMIHAFWLRRLVLHARVISAALGCIWARRLDASAWGSGLGASGIVMEIFE